jgi:hypothetical protein
MTTVLWLAAFCTLAFFGGFVFRLRFVQSLEWPARIAVALAVGTTVCGALMFLMSVAGIPWSRMTLAIPMLIGAAFIRRGDRVPMRAITWPGVVFFGLLLGYALLMAFATCGDLLFFWGPKAVHFYRVGKIDPAFLGAGSNVLMHSDYPPLLPLAFAFASQATHGLSWWGALGSGAILLTAAAAGFRGIARHAIGEEQAARFATLLAATLAFGVVCSFSGGAAEPLLLFLAVIAVTALTFAGHDRQSLAIASIALAGVVFTKVEGAAFAAMIVFAFLIVRRRPIAAIAISVAPVALLVAWIAFARHHGLLDQYRLAGRTLHWEMLPNVIAALLREARYGAFWLPWLVVFSAIAIGRDWRRAALPFLAAAASVVCLIYFYLHSPDAISWIRASAQRVLLTPLAFLVIAAAAATASRSPARTA